MYIEFDIQANQEDFEHLEYRIHQWANDHGITFSTKLAKNHKYRLGLNHPKDFTLFFMTWQGPYTVKNINRS